MFLDIFREASIFFLNSFLVERDRNRIASISKELLNLTDTYVLDVADPADALYVLMFVLAVDAEKCSRD